MVTAAVLFCLAGAFPQQTLESKQLKPPKSLSAGAGGAWLDRPLAIEGHIGFGTPVGLLGVAVDLSVGRYFSVGLGLGVAAAGAQIAMMPRFRIPLARNVGLGIGGGISGGPYESQSFAFDHVDSLNFSFAVWLNGEVSVEFRGDSGFTLRSYAGVGGVLNPDSCSAYNHGGTTPGDSHTRSPCSTYYAQYPNGERTKPISFVGIAIGYSF